jgi:hypothetical protein
MALLAAVAGLPSLALANESPTACGGDIVFFVDFSGSMFCRAPDGPLDDCGGLARIAQSILELIQTINPDDNVARFDFTVYAVNATTCVQPFLDIELLFPQRYEFRSFGVLAGQPKPYCLSTPFGCAGDADGEQEEWGPALAYAAIHHPWNGPACIDRKRWYFSFSDEAAKCGNPCDMRLDNPNTPQDELGADRRAVIEASACALRKNVRAHPIVRACPSVIIEGSSDPGLYSGYDPESDASQTPPPPIPATCVCDPINDNGCVVSAARLMAKLTTGSENRALQVDQWSDTTVDFAGNDINKMTFFMTQQILTWACSDQGCDSIDFNGDGLFPADEDLVDFLAVLAGGTCTGPNAEQLCGDLDFNNDCLYPSDEDLVSFLSVLAGGSCAG